MKTYLLADPVRYLRMTTSELRDAFLIGSLCQPGSVQLAYVDLDRAIVGMATPTVQPLVLPTDGALKSDYFTERRELGVLNIGGRGRTTVGDDTYALDNLDCLYIGRGSPKIVFTSESAHSPAIFYLLSYPAHTTFQTTLVQKGRANPTELGSAETSNKRTIYKYVFLDGAKSCQLVMGVTHLHPGSVWNTMPPHTHMRRSEIYMYFNLAPEARVFHLMGPGEETRHIVMQNYDVAVSPGWSIHAGAGTCAYSFCWGMGGENQDYADMDPVPIVGLQ
ncbi:5-dehydro-4-deoxy-D-glucuronate isomerase [Alloacidobacterium dinghuense]|uniref:5-dehydro-4-deoxy-D-glucuronate isomerase n=1 Tax=Alloacidobacterium dinghuense TaxID=2763107 RepID=A0A7G8BK72_9BACT|nr:5-dehydro-4-deoxy-D-glucuronate isomerase [Alloacidobacterium dinghuense]QNI32942.1 5-dehydro-4-deoxy-D-glucuronate isomerase [Alloacidobacterium dinghuense]